MCDFCRFIFTVQFLCLNIILQTCVTVMCNTCSLTYLLTGEIETEIEQGLTSHQTHYRSYRGRVFMGRM